MKPTGSLTESKARVEQQKQRVANLEAATARSKALLRDLEDTLLLITTQREALIQELGHDLQSTPLLRDPPHY